MGVVEELRFVVSYILLFLVLLQLYSNSYTIKAWNSVSEGFT
jgi:hypothetical protein